MSQGLPHRIGRYHVVGRLATGGMAEILLGKIIGPSGFQRAVVIKRILPHLARQQHFVEMFLDEARMTAGIQHPNVVQVVELGRDADELFLVMEYLEGETAGTLMRHSMLAGAPLPRHRAAWLVAEAAAGLHAAHDHKDEDGNRTGLVHRDISPQNLFVTYDGHVKLLDFGIAKAANRLAETQTGQLKGKFSYMSPEQSRGEPLDGRSDVFSLGVVLWELTTGRRLFKRPSELMVLRAICEDPIPRPSDRVKDYPERLDAICMKALARERDQRYATAAELRRDVMSWLRAEGHDEAAQGEVAQSMQQLFGERIAEKKALLKRVQSGPADDVIDLDLSIEAGSMSPAGDSFDGEPAVPLRRKARVWPYVVLGVGALAATVGIGVVVRKQPAPPPVAVAPATPPPAPTPPPVPEPPQQVSVRVESVPAGAHVWIGGKEVGRTPYELVAPRGREAVGLELRLDGYVTHEEVVQTDVDQRLRLSLVRVAKPAPARPTRPAKKPAPTGPRFHRFD